MHRHTRSLRSEGDPDPGTHSHRFGVDQRGTSERRTQWVVLLTVAMMIAEIAGGTIFGSMALLADGWHMGTHAAALAVAMFAYAYARWHAADPRYSFGTGKVDALGGFASAIALAAIALMVIGESVTQLASPSAIRFDDAILVAVVGLMVNLGCAALLRGHHHHGREDLPHLEGHHHDHNLRGVYLHVLADALTSVLAIAALVAGKALGWLWMDPAMGVVGGLVIVAWSYGLLRDTSTILLDGEISEERRNEIRGVLEAMGDDRVSDLHVWRVGPRHFAAIVAVVSASPRPPSYYRRMLARHLDLVHVTVEVQPRTESAGVA